MENFGKIFKPKAFYDISQCPAPYKHHISYDKSFKKFNGGGVVVACLIIVSLQVLDMGLDLELDNYENRSQVEMVKTVKPSDLQGRSSVFQLQFCLERKTYKQNLTV